MLLHVCLSVCGINNPSSNFFYSKEPFSSVSHVSPIRDFPPPNLMFLLLQYCYSALGGWTTIDDPGPEAHVSYSILEQAHGHTSRRVHFPVAGKLSMDRIYHPGWGSTSGDLTPPNLSRILPKKADVG